MVQAVFKGLVTLMLAKFMLNDVPHAAGLLENSGMPYVSSWDSAWKSCVRAARILGKELTEQDIPTNWGEMKRLHKDLWAQVRGRKYLKK